MLNKNVWSNHVEGAKIFIFPAKCTIRDMCCSILFDTEERQYRNRGMNRFRLRSESRFGIAIRTKPGLGWFFGAQLPERPF